MYTDFSWSWFFITGVKNVFLSSGTRGALFTWEFHLLLSGRKRKVRVPLAQNNQCSIAVYFGVAVLNFSTAVSDFLKWMISCLIFLSFIAMHFLCLPQFLQYFIIISLKFWFCWLPLWLLLQSIDYLEVYFLIVKHIVGGGHQDGWLEAANMCGSHREEWKGWVNSWIIQVHASRLIKEKTLPMENGEKQDRMKAHPEATQREGNLPHSGNLLRKEHKHWGHPRTAVGSPGVQSCNLQPTLKGGGTYAFRALRGSMTAIVRKLWSHPSEQESANWSVHLSATCWITPQNFNTKNTSLTYPLWNQRQEISFYKIKILHKALTLWKCPKEKSIDYLIYTAVKGTPICRDEKEPTQELQ